MSIILSPVVLKTTCLPSGKHVSQLSGPSSLGLHEGVELKARPHNFSFIYHHVLIGYRVALESPTVPSFTAFIESTSFLHLQGHASVWIVPGQTGLPWEPWLGPLQDLGVTREKSGSWRCLSEVPKGRCTVFMDTPSICASLVEIYGVKRWEHCSKPVSPKQRMNSTHSPWDVFGRSLDLVLGFPDGSEGKASACNAGDPGLIPRLGRSPGEGNGNPLQYSCLENSMDWGAW